ncbi:hypothetical protein [Mucilaginibacter ginsenosidivorans]|uniref:Uncharacterized protein n=1 Tax=Mucilaginibacter ginsenosidivorans TaxID=398053 RepID=A0A5B8UTJ6_9SPHI|nr:hypothetical protein [Mucilaginibacter ginsenosidivorans]QEC62427.1 hypothetical protein FRZ54_07450 [Mucilaginibacter ginsenosidivorans]
MDSSPDNSTKNLLVKFVESKKQLFNLLYAHCPSKNQSQLRNLSVAAIPETVKSVMLLDSDIYINKQTLVECHEALTRNKNIGALAPPLFSYFGGKHAACLAKANKYLDSGSDLIIMPDKGDYNNNQYRNGLLVTKLLRGAFFLKKSMLYRNFPYQPWLESFTVWENVPFFLTMSELKISFGYLIGKSTAALHDERPHKDTIRFSLKSWHAETIKSIILLLYRNKLYLKSQQRLNSRFLGIATEIIKNHQVEQLTKPSLSLVAARYLSLPEGIGKKKLLSLTKNKMDINFKEALILLTSLNWNDLKRVKSESVHVKM